MDYHIKTALVFGAGGFIGHNLVRRLKREGWYVVGVDLKKPQWEVSNADEFHTADARTFKIDTYRYFDRIYQLAADMGGAGFVFTKENDADILSNSLAINLNVLSQLVSRDGKRSVKCGTIFFSSSACAYPDGVSGKEEDAYPANPPYDYRREKIISERMYQAYARNYGVDVRIARFQNTFGENGTFRGGREKSPAAICRKVAEATESIDVCGDGRQVRPFIYIYDLLDGIEALMQSDYQEPINLGTDDSITITELAEMIIDISGKNLKINYISGPTGEMRRNCDTARMKEVLKWEPTRPLRESFEKTYKWIEKYL